MLRAELLGRFDLWLDDEPVELKSRPARTLLAYLLLNRDQTHSRVRLAGLLWPDFAESSARRNLRYALWQLRKAIGTAYLVTDRTSAAFDATAPYELDVAILESEAALDRLDDLIHVVSLYRGDLLPEFYEDWALLERERLRALFERRAQTLLEGLAQAGRWPEVLTWSEHWIALGHVPEPAYRALMEAHAALGDWAGMETAYRRCVRALRDELDVSPSPETETLRRQLGQGKASRRPSSEEYRRAKNAGVVQPAGPPAAPGASVHNLPPRSAPFVGREKELAEVRHLLIEEPACRLLSLVGPGGIGKTRLALEAVQAIQYAHGAWFVPLAATHSGRHVVSVISDALPFPLHKSPDGQQQLLAYLRDRELVLVLDSFESVRSPLSSSPSLSQAAGSRPKSENPVALVAEILERAPRVKILVTSQERLNLSTEWVLNVGGLQVPELAEVEAWEDASSQGLGGPVRREDELAMSAVQLFIQRARPLKRDVGSQAGELACIARICRLVGGTPLAIELAAAWANVLSCSDILREITQGLGFLTTSLRDLPERHHNMLAVLDSSWNRLVEPERRLFRQLSVFRGGFTRGAAEAVGSDLAWSADELRRDGEGTSTLSRRQPEVLAALVGLVEKSFIRYAGSARYETHELLRQYGAERLASSPEDEVQAKERHCEYYLAFLARHESRMKGADQRIAHERVSGEIENIRVAWRWAIEHRKVDLLLRSIEALWLSIAERNRYHDGLDLVDGSIARLEEPSGTGTAPRRHGLLLGVLTVLRGGILMRLGYYAPALAALERGIELLRAQDAGRWVALGLNWKAAIFHALGRRDAERSALEDSLVLSGQAGDRWLTAYSLNELAMVTHQEGDFVAAQRMSKDSLDILSTMGDHRGAAFALNNLGFYAFQSGDYVGAQRLYRESLRLRQENDDQWGVASTLFRLGLVSLAMNRREKGREFMLEALRTAWEIQSLPIVLDALVELAGLLVEEGEGERACEILKNALPNPALTKPAGERAAELMAALSEQGLSCADGPQIGEEAAARLAAVVAVVMGHWQAR